MGPSVVGLTPTTERAASSCGDLPRDSQGMHTAGLRVVLGRKSDSPVLVSGPDHQSSSGSALQALPLDDFPGLGRSPATTACATIRCSVRAIVAAKGQSMDERSHTGAETCQVRSIHPEAVARAQANLKDANAYGDLAELFAALADATRARIVHALLHQELCTCDIAAVAGISESGASQHLRVLRSLRLVKS